MTIPISFRGSASLPAVIAHRQWLALYHSIWWRDVLAHRAQLDLLQLCQ